MGEDMKEVAIVVISNVVRQTSNSEWLTLTVNTHPTNAVV